MVTLAERILDRVDKGYSRRGFMAACGRLVVGIGAVMTGVASLPERAWGQGGFCCPGSQCQETCPGAPGCPAVCTPDPSSTRCCAGGVEQLCISCSCPSGTCFCQYATPNGC